MTAHEQHAVEAFDLNAVDYVLKPVREERLAEAVRRVVEGGAGQVADRGPDPVELGGVTRFVSRADVRYVEAQGDYARLHTADGSHLVRTPLTTLEERVGRLRFRPHPPLPAGVARPRGGDPHRRRPVHGAGRGAELEVSRRHTRELRDLLVRRNRPGSS